MKTPREFAEDIGFVLFGDNMNEDDLVHIEAQIDAVQRDAIEAAAKVADEHDAKVRKLGDLFRLSDTNNAAAFYSAADSAKTIGDAILALVPNAGGERGT